MHKYKIGYLSLKIVKIASKIATLISNLICSSELPLGAPKTLNSTEWTPIKYWRIQYQ